MTVAELDARMDLEEFLEWQVRDQWRIERAERERAEREAIEAGEPTEDMREEARELAAELGVTAGEPKTMREEALELARELGVPVEEP